MKRLIAFLLISLGFFPLFAQTRNDIVIYVPRVTGWGGTADDPAFFSNMFIMEVSARSYAIGHSRGDSDYTLSGNVSTYQAGYQDEDELQAPLYALHVSLTNNLTSQVVVEQDLVYEIAAETNEVLPVLIFNMLASIPIVKVGYNDSWRNKWWYFSIEGFWSPRLYSSKGTSINALNFGGGAATEVQFFNFMSFKGGVDIVPDTISVSSDEVPTGIMLEAPFMLKLVLKPGLYYMLEPYGGIQINAPLTGEIAPSLLSWLAGFQYGVKAGEGVFFVDGRVVYDLEATRLPSGSVEPETNRIMLKIGIGLKYGIFTRKK
jgi:hypothetical protein